MTAEQALLPARTYLVLLKDSFVAEDVVRAIAAEVGAEGVLTASSAETALALLHDHGPVEVALVQMGPEELRTSALGQALILAGTRIALTGSAAEESRAAEFEVLHRPFTDRDLWSSLIRPSAG